MSCKKYDFDKVVDRSKTHSKKWTDWSSRGLKANNDVLPLWIADMDFMCEERIISALNETLNWGVLGYDGAPEDFYDSFISWKKRRFNWDLNKECFLPTPGIVPAISNAVLSLTEKGDKILIQSPVYYPFFTAIEINNRTLVENRLIEGKERYEIDFIDLEEKLKDSKMMILCNPHNPVGRVYTKDELLKIGNLCVKYGVILVSDEIHSDLVFKNYKHISVATLSDEIANVTITLTAPSKTFNIAGLAQSVAIIQNQKLREQFENGLKGFGLMHMSTFGITGFNAAYKYGEEWLDEVMQYLESNVDYVMEYLSKNLPQVKVYRPEATFLMWLDFREVEKDLVKLDNLLLNDAKVLLDNGASFGKPGEGFYRLNIGTSRSILEEAFDRLSKALNNY